MSESVDIQLFDTLYKKAVRANNAGDTRTASALFMQAAEVMERLAQTDDKALAQTRFTRADKLKNIAVALSEGNSGKTDAAPQKSAITPSKPTERVSFDDIVGLDEAKAAIFRILINPLKNPQAYKKYGIKAGGYILLEGPPGTGKTLFAKAVASELDMLFSDVNANTLVDPYIGNTGKNIEVMFTSARSASAERGAPVVLFIDELDYIAQKRGGENKTAAEAVPTLIKEMDGFSTDASDIVIIAATNLKSALDPAVLSRFGNIIHIPLPTVADRKNIFLKKLAVLESADIKQIDFDEAAALSDGFSGRDIDRVTLELKSALAARDAGLSPLTGSVGVLLKQIISRRAAAKSE